MKPFYFVSTFFMMLVLLTGCSDDDVMTYPASDMPEINVTRDELYSNPNRAFQIKANLKDDLGLKNLKISCPEFFLDKNISFLADTMTTEYELSYEFLAPQETKREETYIVNLMLEDVSGNKVTKALTLYLDGDFKAPQFSDVQPADGTVQILDGTNELSFTLSFKVTDDSGLSKLLIEEPILGIKEEVTLNNEKEYTFEKTYSLPQKAENYQIKLTAYDNFVDANECIQNINYVVSSEMVTLYLADVAKDTDLETDAFGVPVLYHKKSSGIFTFKYCCNYDNQEIYFLGQSSSFAPHCFGLDENGILVNDGSAAPIVLPTKGYYEIKVDTKNLTYEVNPYQPQTAPHVAPIMICGGGIDGATWDPGTAMQMTQDADDKYIWYAEVDIIGSVCMTISTPGWAKYWRLLADGVIDYMGSEQPYHDFPKGKYKFSINTETARARCVK